MRERETSTCIELKKQGIRSMIFTMTFTIEELEVMHSCVKLFRGENGETDAVLKKLEQRLDKMRRSEISNSIFFFFD
jgi:hypothetical protein